ncbi:MAG: methyltransferase domain-containing protein [Paracoccaceae bacterium]
MHLDVVDLRNFYYRTGLGRLAQRAIRDQVTDLWPEAKGQTVVGYGFAVPLLRPFIADARRTIALMPGPQGVMHWPVGMENVSVLCEETSWPLETGHVDKLILMHGLETSENPSALLDECWRVLGPGGKAILIVPNRAGFWSRTDVTPFGFGRPYSAMQLDSQLKKHQFIPERHRAALYQPPSHKKIWMKSGKFLEKYGRVISARFVGGALIVEFSKRAHVPKRPGLPEAVKRPLKVLDGIAKPASATQGIASPSRNP